MGEEETRDGKREKRSGEQQSKWKQKKRMRIEMNTRKEIQKRLKMRNSMASVRK
jgi:hypothetical protein